MFTARQISSSLPTSLPVCHPPYRNHDSQIHADFTWPDEVEMKMMTKKEKHTVYYHSADLMELNCFRCTDI